MNLLTNGPPEAPLTVLLAHGAGTPMNHPFLTAAAIGIGAAGFHVVRFEFPYMAARRVGGKVRPPDREPVLLETIRTVFAGIEGPVVVGGKSMGGRMASMIADELGAAGLLVFGYPFHPIGRPERLRAAHLAGLRIPALIVQGTRDPFGTREEVERCSLSAAIRLAWVEGGNHDLGVAGIGKKPLETVLAGPISSAAAFLEELAARRG